MFDICHLAAAQEIYSERQPYIEETKLSGDVIIFDETYIRLLREALSTGCMAKMSEEEAKLTQEFVQYQDGTLLAVPADVLALDAWIVNIANCVANPVIGECDTAEHTYTVCT